MQEISNEKFLIPKSLALNFLLYYLLSRLNFVLTTKQKWILLPRPFLLAKWGQFSLWRKVQKSHLKRRYFWWSTQLTSVWELEPFFGIQGVVFCFHWIPRTIFHLLEGKKMDYEMHHFPLLLFTVYHVLIVLTYVHTYYCALCIVCVL